MKNPINQHLKTFLKNSKLEGKTIACAVSCGLDSMVLFHALIDLKKEFKFKLYCFHVHHGWRKESDGELLFLQNFCKQHHINLFFKHLHLDQDLKSAEELARKKRYDFFKTIYHQERVDGIFLGHHEDDLAETILKRVFEGSNLLNLSPMKEVSVKDEMILYRPLLQFSKKDIYEIANVSKIQFFDDQTNFDVKFQRSMMRQQILPYIEEKFKKSIKPSLLNLKFEAEELEDFIKDIIAKNVIFYSGQKFHLLSIVNQQPGFIVKNIIIFFSKRWKFTLSKDMVKNIKVALLNSLEPKKFKLGSFQFLVSKSLFVVLDIREEGYHLDEAFTERIDRQALEKIKFPPWFIKKFPSFLKKEELLLNN